MYIVKRKSGKNAYYYAVEKKRIDGKVKTVKQIYLGTSDKIINQLTEKGGQALLKTKTFGSIALLLSIEKTYCLEQLFDESLKKKRNNNVSGKYYLSIIFNRILKPKSKAGIDDWLKETYLDWFWNINTSSQKLWNHLCYLDDDVIDTIGNKIADKTFEIINDDQYLWDTSNYFTYINNRESKLLGKGKSKQGRHDKNLICHGVLVSKESRIPVWQTQYKYKHDSKILNEKINEISQFLKRYRKKEFTLIMDKGNNSKDNIKLLSKYSFIGSLRAEQTRELFKIPLKEYECEYENRKENCVRVHDAGIHKLYESEYRIVVSYEEASYKKQKKTFEMSLEETFKKYEEIKDKKYDKNMTAMNALKKILPRKRLKAFNKNVVGKDKKWVVELSKNESEIKTYKQSFGKTAVFTNIEKDDAIDIIKSYRSLNIVEDQFKALHNSFMIPITPTYEWTDQKIKAHVFLCFIALVLVRVLEFEARAMHINKTYTRLLEEAGNIRMGLVLDGKKAEYCFEQMTVEQQELMNLFGLHEFAKF